MNRLVIYPKDIAMLTGKSERHARRILDQIKKQYNKMPHQMITIEECCQYFGIAPENIKLL